MIKEFLFHFLQNVNKLTYLLRNLCYLVVINISYLPYDSCKGFHNSHACNAIQFNGVFSLCFNVSPDKGLFAEAFNHHVDTSQIFT